MTGGGLDSAEPSQKVLLAARGRLEPIGTALSGDLSRTNHNQGPLAAALFGAAAYLSIAMAVVDAMVAGVDVMTTPLARA